MQNKGRELMNIIQDFIPAGRRNRPGTKMTPKYITVHDTQNLKEGSDAENHAKFLKDSAANIPASWHFTVDHDSIIQHLPLNEAGFHATDGRTGPGNTQSIAVEITENPDGDRAKAEDNAAKLIADLLKQFNLGIDRVVQHNKWYKKDCPKVLRNRPNGWVEFLKKVESYQTNVHVMEFSPSQYDFKVDLGTPKKLETVSEIVKMRGAHAGINLGFFDMSGKAEHYSLLMRDGKIENPPNHVMECWYTKDNKLIVQDISTNQQVPLDAQWAVGLSFSLIIDGKKDIRNYEKFPHYKRKEPRTAIGQKANGNIILVAVDSPGMTADELADYMLSLGCVVAINADGGGSTTMVKEGKVINNPEYGKERSVGSVLLVYPKGSWKDDVMNRMYQEKIINSPHNPDSPVTWAELAAVIGKVLDRA